MQNFELDIRKQAPTRHVTRMQRMRVVRICTLAEGFPWNVFDVVTAWTASIGELHRKSRPQVDLCLRSPPSPIHEARHRHSSPPGFCETVRSLI